MGRSLKSNFNLDKLRICYKQSNEIFSYISDTKPNSFIDRGAYKLHVLADENGEDNPQNIFVNVLIEDNRLLGQFVFNNSRKYEGLCFFSFSNSMLYNCLSSFNGEKYNFAGCIEYIADDLNLIFNSITEVEIALDTTTQIIYRTRKLITDTENVQMFVNGRRITDEKIRIQDYAEYFTRSRRKIDTTPTIYIRQKRSDAPFLRIYNKTIEINANGNTKNYITEWNNFGQRNIYRAEIRLKSNSLKEFWNWYTATARPDGDAPDLLNALISPSTRAAIWLFFSQRILYFRLHDGRKMTLYDIATAPNGL